MSSMKRMMAWGVLGFLSLPGIAEAGSYEDAVGAAAVGFVNFVNLNGNGGSTTVRPDFRGLPSMPGGGGAGFAEIVKEALAPYSIKIGGRAKYSLVAHLELSDDSKTAQLKVSVLNAKGVTVHKIESLPIIDDPRSLAEVLGIPTDFGPIGDVSLRQEVFKREFEDREFFTGSLDGGAGKTLLFSDARGRFGLGLRVAEKLRPFENRDGLPYTNLEFGETYELVLVNNTDMEVAANVKVDGVNVFHFTDTSVPGATRADGTKFKYWIVGPHREIVVRGWYQTSRRQLRFHITPVEEGAAAQAGLPLDDVGLVSVTFHASWEKDEQRPSDEPQVDRTIAMGDPKTTPQEDTTRLHHEPTPHNSPSTLDKPIAPKRNRRHRGSRFSRRSKPSHGFRSSGSPHSSHGPWSARGPGPSYGSAHGATETGSRTGTETSARVATGFGEEILTNSRGVHRTIGISRATLAFRYERE